MSSLAQQALDRARQKLGQPLRTKPVARSAPESKAGQAARQIISLEVVVDGPINHFMYLQGRHHAIDLAGSLSALPVLDVISNLNRSAVGRPASYALGIKSIVDAIEAADINDPALVEFDQ